MYDVQQPHSPPGPAGPDPMVDSHAQPWERTYATFEHLTVFVSWICPVIPALVMWLIKKDESPFVSDHGKEAMNFQISLVIYFAVGWLLTVVCVGFPVLVAAGVLAIVGGILGAVAANKGRYFRYPMCLRLIA